MTDRITKEQVQWVIAREFDSANYGELGVKIGDQIFTMYKGNSIELTEGSWRPLGKRELGEVIATDQNEDQFDWYQIDCWRNPNKMNNFVKSTTKLNHDNMYRRIEGLLPK